MFTSDKKTELTSQTLPCIKIFWSACCCQMSLIQKNTTLKLPKLFVASCNHLQQQKPFSGDRLYFKIQLSLHRGNNYGTCHIDIFPQNSIHSAVFSLNVMMIAIVLANMKAARVRKFTLVTVLEHLREFRVRYRQIVGRALFSLLFSRTYLRNHISWRKPYNSSLLNEK